jgi:predicted CoA-binding protein|uniref:CoA-binding protein n=1 Tax=Desulfobacca acetoxidans TaxID=60893 RepID=A0A7C5EMX4_9BACT
MDEAEFPELNASPEEIADILKTCCTVAVVGLSPQPERPSFLVAQYLKEQGYHIIPVRPGCHEILGEKCYDRLKDIPFPVDVVDIFRSVEAIPGIVDEAIEINAKVVWMQLGLAEPDSARKAKEAGLKVVMNRCMKMEHEGLSRQGFSCTLPR